MKTKHTATLSAILAAALYAINIPLSKILLEQVEPTMMAATAWMAKDTIDLQYTHKHAMFTPSISGASFIPFRIVSTGGSFALKKSRGKASGLFMK